MSAEVSDQVVKMMLNGVEVSAKIAGQATKHLVACLLALRAGDKKVGKTSVAKIVNQSKNVRVFSIKDEDLSTFKSLAKKYGILYSVIRDLNLGDGLKDVMIKGEDASKLQRVFDVMGYGNVEHEKEQNIENDTKKKQASKQEPESQKFKQEHTNIDMEQGGKDFRSDNRDAMTPDSWNESVKEQSKQERSKQGYDFQPDPVNGLDGKDPNEIQPQNKSELASQMQGKPIATRKNLAEDYIKREQTKQEATGKMKKKTKARRKVRKKR